MFEKSISSQGDLFDSLEAANDYINVVRNEYRVGHGEYRGRRNPEQQIIAEVTSDEADQLVDGFTLSVLALGGLAQIPHDADEYSIGNHTWSDFKSEYRRLLVGFAVMTNRLERDGHGVASYSEMTEQDRHKVASILFSDFMLHNSLRFGVETSGVHRSKRVDNEDGGIDVVYFDKDAARSDREIERNMAHRSYTTGPATHPAGKLSPSEYKRLRREFPEEEKDMFDQIIGFSRHAAEALRERNQ